MSHLNGTCDAQQCSLRPWAAQQLKSYWHTFIVIANLNKFQVFMSNASDSTHLVQHRNDRQNIGMTGKNPHLWIIGHKLNKTQGLCDSCVLLPVLLLQAAQGSWPQFDSALALLFTAPSNKTSSLTIKLQSI